ncbi:hypothetical protein BJ999_005078 [Actinomadura citrea]|uniref:Uncharacterized protein n=1 Tax=Actinomadura citrea TaxID=46158 RepID=A0A7Y9KD74_9ACTN|nr:hypothetical protein [Actinomadura citrea]
MTGGAAPRIRIPKFIWGHRVDPVKSERQNHDQTATSAHC